MLTTLLNTAFVGKTLDQLTPELMRVAEHAAGSSYGLISLVVSFAMEVLDALVSWDTMRPAWSITLSSSRIFRCSASLICFVSSRLSRYIWAIDILRGWW